MKFKCSTCKSELQKRGINYTNNFRYFYCKKCVYGVWIDIKTKKDHYGKKYEQK